MSGYFGYSKSFGAIEAESEGYYPASILAKKLNVKTEAIRTLLKPVEWHHTSKFYNKTDYYSEEEAIKKIKELKAWKEIKTKEQIYDNCYGSYVEWTGNGRYWRHRIIEFEKIKVAKKNNTFKLFFPGGRIVIKRKTAKGFNLYTEDGKSLLVN